MFDVGALLPIYSAHPFKIHPTTMHAFIFDLNKASELLCIYNIIISGLR